MKKGRSISEDHQHEERLNFKVCLEICVTANTAAGLRARQRVCVGGRASGSGVCPCVCVCASALAITEIPDESSEHAATTRC